MSLWLAGLIFVGGLVLLIGGAGALVRGAAGVAAKLRIRSFVVGLTVVAFGTSGPELATGVGASLRGMGELNVGNVVGSNIANICLVLGVMAMVRPVPCSSRIVRLDVPIMLVVTLLGIGAFFGGSVERWEGVVLLAGIVGYVVFSYRYASREEPDVASGVAQQLEEYLHTQTPRDVGSWWMNGGLLLGGMVGLTLGSLMLVEAVEASSEQLGVPEYVVGLTGVALGTSLPELATCTVAAVKREGDIALGNVLGSNIFNLLCVLGVTSLVAPIPVPESVMQRDVWIMLIAALACLPIMGSGARISRGEGVCLFVAYVCYMAVSTVVY